MRRQLQGQYPPFPGATRVAQIAEGGTGATTPEDAATNLKAIHKSRYNVPSGLVQADELGRFPFNKLPNGMNIGYSIEGPLSLVYGQTSVYTITNYNALSPAVVSVDSGSVAVAGDQITVTAPTDRSKTAVVVTIGARQITIPVYEFGPTKPQLLVKDGSTVNRNFTIVAAPYNSEPEVKSGWVAVTGTTGTVSIPAGTTYLEVRGKSDVSGLASVTLGSETHTLPVSTVYRRFKITVEQSVAFVLTAPGAMDYRFISPSSLHLSTDWQVASDPAFTTIVKQSLNDTVNKTTWTVYLPLGTYYVRVKYRGQLVGT